MTQPQSDTELEGERLAIERVQRIVDTGIMIIPHAVVRSGDTRLLGRGEIYIDDDDRAALRVLLVSHADLARRLLEATQKSDLFSRGYDAMQAADISEYLALCASVRLWEAEFVRLLATLSERERELAEARKAKGGDVQ